MSGRSVGQEKKLLAKFIDLGYTTVIYFDGKENFDIWKPTESRWMVQTGGCRISFHFPDRCKKASAHQGESPGVVSLSIR